MLYLLIEISAIGAFYATLCAQDAMKLLKIKHTFSAIADGLGKSGLHHPSL
jgi:hypothetical protein